MEKKTVELVFVIDQSGSMYGYEKDTIGGFNSTIAKQKNDAFNVLVSTVLFSTDFITLHDRVKIDEVKEMTEKDYTAGGCTALYDAVGDTIEKISMIHKYAREEDVPVKTLFVIITDGMENASTRFNNEKVRALIKEKENCDWEFLFLGANIDVEKAADDIGIAREKSASYKQSEKGYEECYDGLSNYMCDVMCDMAVSYIDPSDYQPPEVAKKIKERKTKMSKLSNYISDETND